MKILKVIAVTALLNLIVCLVIFFLSTRDMVWIRMIQTISLTFPISTDFLKFHAEYFYHHDDKLSKQTKFFANLLDVIMVVTLASWYVLARGTANDIDCFIGIALFLWVSISSRVECQP